MNPMSFVLVIALGLVPAAHGLAPPALAQGGPNALPLPDPNLDTLPPQQGISLGGGVRLSPGVGIQDGFSQDSLNPAPLGDASSMADTDGLAPGGGGDTDMGTSGATISIPLN